MKKVLVGVVGASPSVITETIYALAQRTPAWIPDEVHLYTTGFGRQVFIERLFNNGVLDQLLETIGPDAQRMAFGPENLHVFRSPDGDVLDDLRTPEEIARGGDLIAREIAHMTVDDDVEIHATLAGGRKTMSFYMGYAMTLFGRVQDRLSHVLVNAPFETEPGFYFPEQAPTSIERRNGEVIDARDAVIDLAEVPFLRVGHWMKKDTRQRFLGGEFKFIDCVRWAQVMIERPCVQIDVARSVLRIGATDPVEVTPDPRHFVHYLWVALRILEGTAPVDISEPRELVQLLMIREQLGHNVARSDEAANWLAAAQAIDPREFAEPRSRIGTLLEASVGPEGRLRYGFHSPAKMRWTLRDLTADAITIVDEQGTDWLAVMRGLHLGPANPLDR